jgi:hypothetical protein
VTTLHVSPGLAVAVTLEQVTLGGSVSLTVTVNEQPGPAIVVQVTVVVPFGKKEPDGGVHVTVPQPPVVVGGG